LLSSTFAREKASCNLPFTFAFNVSSPEFINIEFFNSAGANALYNCGIGSFSASSVKSV